MKASAGVLNEKACVPDSSRPSRSRSPERAVAVYLVAADSLPPLGMKTKVEASLHLPEPASGGEKSSGYSAGLSVRPTASSETASWLKTAFTSAPPVTVPCGENERMRKSLSPTPRTGATTKNNAAAASASAANKVPERYLLSSITRPPCMDNFSNIVSDHILKHTLKLQV